MICVKLSVSFPNPLLSLVYERHRMPEPEGSLSKYAQFTCRLARLALAQAFCSEAEKGPSIQKRISRVPEVAAYNQAVT